MPRRSSGSDAHNRRSSIANPSSQPATPPRPSPATAGPGHARNPKMAVLAAANRLRDTTGTPGRSVSGTLGAAPLVVESQRYEEWMKIATDNKITSTNTWNLALIDYFHDMSLLRNGDDNSINFQKASCTLDGCVKIWTSRVDSVATETGKLLSGLGDDAQPMDDEDMDGEGEDGEGRPEKRARKRTARQAATLADDFAKLRVKQFDLEFTVDPLFKKTSADFDEGGAGGILMNHLGCDGSMKVVFDAGDAKLDCDEEDEDEDEEAVRAKQAQDETLQVDLSRLRDRCLPAGLDPLASMTLCPSLSFFRFSDAHLDLGLLNLGGDDDEDDEVPFGARKTTAARRDLPEGGDDDHAVDFGDAYMNQDFGGGGEDFGGDADDGVDFFADQFSSEAVAYGLAGAGPVASGSGLGNSTGGGGGTGFGAVEPFDPRRMADERDLVMSMEGDGDGMFEYFDAKLGKNWAGPEHWKMRRAAAVKKEDGAPAAKKERKEKVAFSIDFSNPPPLSAKELFASANPKSSITTATRKTARKATAVNGEDNFTLPDDYHFNSQNLLRLFLKPKMTLRMRRRNVQLGEPTGGEEDVRFWAQAGAAGGALGEEGYGGGMDPMDHDFNQDFGGGGDGDDDDPPPFDTQWLAGGEDDFSPDLEDEEGGGKELDDLAAATQGQLRRVRPEMVSYAKRAKRVDIKKLKDSVWRELEEVVLPVKHYPESPSYDPKEPLPEVVEATPAAKDVKPRKKAEALVPVVSGLRKLYPKDKMEEISTSFMFICLLHLANEKGLRLQTPRFEQDDEDAAHDADMQKIVGGLESLRVLKEVA
ncbi:hypothetical protein BMF94_1923 [Rhodotorula taiwanensis]|uniref:Condensin complex subunit 2 n=1 Tax=Rhodotorula taiwanensis TaxID=741276 RepID=A0A2S5BDV9_9BASI|nr:hypothetical protein BMF94_1923 [Rhodotorula taiwanensis]